MSTRDTDCTRELQAHDIAPPPLTDIERGFRHSHWHRHRTRISNALARLPLAQDRKERFDCCGHTAWVMQSAENPDVLKVSAEYCHDRFCNPCQHTRARLIAENMKDYIGNKQIRMITLTVATDGLSLPDSLKILYDGFRHLRRTKLWKSKVFGGCAFLEVKRSATSERWHPHLHILCEGLYIETGHLALTWHNITKTSFIVDVRLVGSPDKVCDYVVKYLTKPMALRYTNHEHLLDETMMALKGRRSILAFGTWYRLKLNQPISTDTWRFICTLDELIKRSNSNELFAQRVLATLTEHAPWPDTLTNPKPSPRSPPSPASPSVPSVVKPLRQRTGLLFANMYCATIAGA